jgi:hypothetical protein
MIQIIWQATAPPVRSRYWNGFRLIHNSQQNMKRLSGNWYSRYRALGSDCNRGATEIGGSPILTSMFEYL